MAHTPEQCARRVLAVMKDFKVNGGEILTQGSFVKPFTSHPWTFDDLNVGINEAVRRGWITVESDGFMLRLTQSGASEIA
jgi:hypothetical protein